MTAECITKAVDSEAHLNFEIQETPEVQMLKSLAQRVDYTKIDALVPPPAVQGATETFEISTLSGNTLSIQAIRTAIIELFFHCSVHGLFFQGKSNHLRAKNRTRFR